MQRLRSNSLIHGVIGGLVAGAVVALWFLIVDLATAEPFRTPSVLAGAVLGREVTEPAARLVAVYTVLHFVVFALLGLFTAWLIQRLDLHPGLLLGIVFGLGILDAVHYGALLITGANVLTILPTWQVLAANLLAGVALMVYLHRALKEDLPLGLGMLRFHPLLVRGLFTGLVGAVAVAFWFLVIDTFAGRPFFTPAALGSLFLLGAQIPSDVNVSLGVIATYTLLHLLSFAVVGVFVVWVAERLERTPGWWLIALMTFIVLEAIFVGTVGAMGGWILGAIQWWAIIGGNLVAIAAMGFWVWSTHPRLQHEFRPIHVETKI